MAYQGIGTGTAPNDNTGDSLLTGAIKINSNFKEIYNALGDGSTLTVGVSTFTNLNISNNLSVSGISTSNESVFKSVCEQVSIVSVGNTSSISYSGGGGNIVYFNNVSGPITLNVNNIPTSNFDNKTISFTLIVNQKSPAYICNDLKMNGVSKSIKWQFGETPSGNPNSIDFINFIGINTVGSGSTTNNYLVIGNVNGDYK